MPFCLKGGKAFGNEDRASASHFTKPIGSKLSNKFALYGSGKTTPPPRNLKSKDAGGR